MRLPGFRKGKAPPSLVIQRLGFGAVLEETVRESLPEWYEEALLEAGLSPIGDPDIEIVSAPQGEGEPLGFKFEIGVRPAAELGDYRGLEVGRDEPQPPEEMVEREIERIRGSFARLEPVERAAADGDVAPDRLRGPDRRQGVRGRQGRRLPAGARQRPADRGIRGSAAGGEPRASRARSRSAFPTTTRPSSSPAKTPSSRSR